MGFLIIQYPIIYLEIAMLTYEMPEDEIRISKAESSELSKQNQQLQEENKALKAEIERLSWMLRTQD